MQVELKVLCDNLALEGFTPAPGLSILVNLGGKKILFDTGTAPEIIVSNAKKLGESLDDIDILVISHAHADHTGGIEAVADKAKKIYLPQPIDGIEEEVIEEDREILEGVKLHIFKKPLREICLQIGGLLLVGCSHFGIENAVRKIRPRVVIGGMHFIGMSYVEVSRIARDLMSLGVRMAGPMHCSLDIGRRVFKEVFGPYYIDLKTGSRLQLNF